MSKSMILGIVLVFMCCITVNGQNPWIDYLNQEYTEVPEELLKYLNVDDSNTLPDVASKENETTLVTLVKKAGLATALSSAGPFTLFGPTNEAFSKVPKWILNYLSKNKTALAQLLKYHVASGSAYSSQLKNNQLVESLAGQKIRINIYQNGKVITASGAQVIKADVSASNGVLHEIKHVMMPPFGDIVQTARAVNKLFILTQLVRYGGLTDALSGQGPFTLFAPTNAAFLRLGVPTLVKLLFNRDALANILKYHLVDDVYYSAGLSNGKVPTLNGKSVKISVNDKGVMVNKAKVVLADLTTTNGVIHVIDRVLMPPKSTDIDLDQPKDFKVITGAKNRNVMGILRLK